MYPCSSFHPDVLFMNDISSSPPSEHNHASSHRQSWICYAFSTSPRDLDSSSDKLLLPGRFSVSRRRWAMFESRRRLLPVRTLMGRTLPMSHDCADPFLPLCIRLNWQCMSNGLCYLENELYYGRYTCTDQTWQSPDCPQICTHNNTAA
jgi:hypothetical protein